MDRPPGFSAPHTCPRRPETEQRTAWLRCAQRLRGKNHGSQWGWNGSHISRSILHGYKLIRYSLLVLMGLYLLTSKEFVIFCQVSKIGNDFTTHVAVPKREPPKAILKNHEVKSENITKGIPNDPPNIQQICSKNSKIMG